MSGLKRYSQSPLRVIWEALKTFSEIDGEQRAAAFAYYALFSLFPFFALMLTAGSSLFDSHDVISTIKRFFPLGEAEQTFVWQMAGALERSRSGVGLASVVILLWCSLKFFQALVRGVNRAWHTVEIPWWQLPLKNLLMIVVIASALLMGLVAPALMQGAKKGLIFFQDLIESNVPGINLDLITSLFDLGRYLLAGSVLFYSFSLLYMLAPRRRVYFRQVWLAAVVVTVLLQICQVAFVNYLPRFVNYNAVYGTVGILMLLLLWVYISGVLIILGACLCSAQARVAGELDVAEPEARPTPSS